MKTMKRILPLILIGILIGTTLFAQKPKRPDPQPAPELEEAFKLGVAGYTFYKFDLQTTLETLQRCDVKYLCIKDFHLPVKSTADEIEAFHKKCADYGVKGYAVGPLYMKTEEDIDKYFDYAKRVGVKTIVGVPGYELLPYVDKKVKEYGFNYAIHLHGPDIEIYQDADEVWEKTKDLDPRIGMCLDIGHDTRNGKDPVADLKKYHTRVFDVHLKDVTGDTKLGYSVEVGRGIIDIPAFVNALREVNYTGVVSLEHERNMDNPFMGIAESIGYFRGIIVSTR
jgi:sugar phosphate isomerase/epimerase